MENIIKSLSGRVPHYFYRIRNEEDQKETYETIGRKFGVDPQVIIAENQNVPLEKDSILVIRLT